MMEKFVLYVGLNDKDSKIQEINTLDASKMVQNLSTRYFDGVTVSSAYGVYKHDSGEVVTEETIRIEIMFTDEKSVKDFAMELKTLLNQESIVFQREIVESELV